MRNKKELNLITEQAEEQKSRLIEEVFKAECGLEIMPIE